MKTVASASLLHHVKRCNRRGFDSRDSARLKRHRQLRRQLLPRLCDSVAQQLCAGHADTAATADQHSVQELPSSWEERAPLTPVRHFGFPLAACRAGPPSGPANLNYATQQVVETSTEAAAAVEEMMETDSVSTSDIMDCCCQAEATIPVAMRALLLLSVKPTASTLMDSSSHLTGGRRSHKRRGVKKLHRRRLNHLLPDATSETWDLPSSTDGSLDWHLLVNHESTCDLQQCEPGQTPQLDPSSVSGPSFTNNSMESRSDGNCNDTAASMDSAFFTCSGIALADQRVSPETADYVDRQNKTETEIRRNCLNLLKRIRSSLTAASTLNLMAATRTRDLLGQAEASLQLQPLPKSSIVVDEGSSAGVDECHASNPSMDTLTCVDVAVAKEAGDNGSICAAQQQQKQQKRHRRQRTHLLRLMGLTRRRRREVQDSVDLIFSRH